MTTLDYDLDQHGLDTVIRVCAPDETDPRWEIAACTRAGDLLTYDGMSGIRMVTMLRELAAEPAVVRVSLTLWVPR